VFHVYLQKTLYKVALLLNKDRLHFSLRNKVSENLAQISPGDAFEVTHGPSAKEHHYEVHLKWDLVMN
jgi:hypothetical protein